MGSKIVTIAVTICMLVMCIVAGIALSVMMSKKESNTYNTIANTTVVDIQNEITEENEVKMTGTQLISAILGTYDIDNKIPDTTEKVYTNNTTGNKIYKFNIDISSINPNAEYTIKYKDSAGNKIEDFTSVDAVYIEVS